MKKRLWSIFLALVICVGLTVPALAATVQTTAGASLTPAEQKLYTALADAVVEVAAGKRTSTEVTITPEQGELFWTAQELGLSSTADSAAIKDRINDKLDQMTDKVYTCLELNFPFDMFWANNYRYWSFWYVNVGGGIQLSKLTCSLQVIPAYRGSTDITVNPDKIAQGRAAAENAKAIVQANAGKSDYEKLTAYRDAICDLTSYNNDIYADWVKDNYMYGDPWQLVYVFDKNPSTNVLCEGYAKAFKYLCDLSEFNGDVACYLIEGNMDNEAHMWNVVRMGDGKFYLADVTNSDTGMTGEHGGLFLTGASGSGRTYVVSHDGWRLTYTYREDQSGLFTDGYLPLSADDYSPANDAAPAPKPTPAPKFTDVPAWCTDAVDWAVAQNVTEGRGGGLFAPADQCKNSEILTFLWRAAKKPMVEAKADIANTPEGCFYYDAAQWANDLGLIDPGTFDPNGLCTRAQAMTFICMAFGVPYDGDEAAKAAQRFSDVDGSATYAYAVAWALENGVTNGFGDEFRPDEVCSRGQIVTFLQRAYVEEARLPVEK